MAVIVVSGTLVGLENKQQVSDVERALGASWFTLLMLSLDTLFLVAIAADLALRARRPALAPRTAPVCQTPLSARSHCSTSR